MHSSSGLVSARHLAPKAEVGEGRGRGPSQPLGGSWVREILGMCPDQPWHSPCCCPCTHHCHSFSLSSAVCQRRGGFSPPQEPRGPAAAVCPWAGSLTFLTLCFFVKKDEIMAVALPHLQGHSGTQVKPANGMSFIHSVNLRCAPPRCFEKSGLSSPFQLLCVFMYAEVTPLCLPVQWVHDPCSIL